jgi:hypothetical protein
MNTRRIRKSKGMVNMWNGEQDGNGSEQWQWQWVGESLNMDHGKDPSNGGKISIHSLDEIFDVGQTMTEYHLDTHISDEIPEENERGLINPAMEKIGSKRFSR